MSACLLGKKVRYDGNALTVADEVVARWRSEGRIVSVCPEVEAGMSIPRKPAEISRGNGQHVLSGEAEVIEKGGHNVTHEFLAGAELALDLCRKFDINVAVLAEFSPSCGSTMIYDGSFSGNKIPGMGVTAALLREHGVRVFSQHQMVEADNTLTGKSV
ncbi:DUF523 domain-containing protein [Halomonas populi]|uniref:DUF523 domain-containing protein n=1 Tax=Vreelandella populi TaxID=2498858 RepID=A0A3S0YPQ6_9GAMM|nr:DUF523 domain-containing protein [Halomonas populi]RUR49019.1 DUF523 domain-containing protein [Halomonas populi]RUR55357.1 DUF523 domain-containing protein [Halomonas populi]